MDGKKGREERKEDGEGQGKKGKRRGSLLFNFLAH